MEDAVGFLDLISYVDGSDDVLRIRFDANSGPSQAQSIFAIFVFFLNLVYDTNAEMYIRYEDQIHTFNLSM